MHVVTDNGSNYKKACKELLSDVYDHIAWTPCLAHTVNLMLKDIARRPEHGVIIKQCKRISNWLHNHGQLNTMMRNAIGGELVKWNATRFGTNYMFLESIYRKRDRFMQWMAYGRSNRAPVLDEDDDDGDIPLPSHIVRDQINVSDLREATGNDSISDWARQNIGDTHLGKRKLHKGPKKGDSKRRKGKGIVIKVSRDTE